MSEATAAPVYCHKCGKDVSGVGFCYHIDRKIWCHECTNAALPTPQREG